jgi:hypothetical protein
LKRARFKSIVPDFRRVSLGTPIGAVKDDVPNFRALFQQSSALFAFLLDINDCAALDRADGPAKVANSVHDANVGQTQVNASATEIGSRHFCSGYIFGICHLISILAEVG